MKAPALMHCRRWRSLVAVLLVTTLVMIGCTRAGEEQPNGREPLHQVERQRDELMAQIKSLEGQRTALEEKFSLIRDQLTESQQAREHLSQERQTLVGQFKVHEAQLPELTRDYEARVSTLTAKLTEVERSFQELGAERDMLLATRTELENRLTTMAQEQQKLRKEMELLTVESGVARSHAERLSAELAQVVSERDQARIQAADLSAQRATLHTQLASITHAKEEANERVTRLSHDLTAAQDELIRTVKARTAAEGQVQALAAKLEAAQRELEIVSRARADLEARASQLRQQLATTTEKVLTLTEEVRHLRDQLRDEDLHQLMTLPETLTKGITFAHRRTALPVEAKKLLDQAVTILQRYPAIGLVIEGYTDGLGEAGFNRLLSEYRANAVRDYLIQRGVAPERLIAIGRGEENPIASNDTPQERFLNRRIKFHLTQKTEDK